VIVSKGLFYFVISRDSEATYKERETFFKILKEVTGINEKNFNDKVGKLIEDSMKSI